MNEIQKRIALSTLSYKDFATLCGVSVVTLRKIERNDPKISNTTIQKIIESTQHFTELETFKNFLELGKLLKQKRLLKQVDRKDFAEKIGISLVTLDAIESGKKAVKIDTYLKIEEALELDILDDICKLMKS